MIRPVLLLCVALVAAAPPARADNERALVDQAIKLTSDFEDAKAADLLNAVLRHSPTAAVAATAHLYLGLIALNALDAERAKLEFRLALKQDPTLELPFDASPKARVSFDQARRELVEDAQQKLSLAPSRPSRPQRLKPAPPPDSDEGVSINHTPSYVVAGAGVGVLIAGTIAGVLAGSSLTQAQSDKDSHVSQSDLKSAGTEGLVADLCFAVGGAAVISGVVLFILELRGEPKLAPAGLRLEAGKVSFDF